MTANVLIVAAPFGFGPAAKALIIGAGLRDIAKVCFSADADAARLLTTTITQARLSRWEDSAESFQSGRRWNRLI